MLEKIMNCGSRPAWLDRSGGVLYIAAWLAAVSALLFSVLFYHEPVSDVAKSYSYLAQEFAHGNWDHFFNPNLPLLLPFFAGVLTRWLPVEPADACILAAGICYLGTLPFLWRLLRNFLNDDFSASLGVLLFTCASQLVRFSCAGWLETGRTFFIIAILALTVEHAGKFRTSHLIWLGVLYGGLCLVRGEGIFFALILAVWSIFLDAARTPAASRKRKTLLDAAIVAAVTLLILIPRSWINWHQTGWFLPDQRIAAIFSKLAGSPPDLANNVGLTRDYFTFSFSAVVRDFADGSEAGYLLLAAIGIFFLIRRKSWRPEYYFLFALALINFLGCLNTVSQHRYFTLNVPLFMVFTVSGVEFLYRLLRSWKPLRNAAPFLLMAAVAAAAVPGFLRGTGYATRGFPQSREIGRYLGEHGRELFGGAERPTIYSGAFPVTTFSGLKVANRYLVDLGDLRSSTAFDGAVFAAGDHKGRRKMTQPEELIRSRADFERIASPYDDYITIYRKKTP